MMRFSALFAASLAELSKQWRVLTMLAIMLSFLPAILFSALHLSYYGFQQPSSISAYDFVTMIATTVLAVWLTLAVLHTLQRRQRNWKEEIGRAHV